MFYKYLSISSILITLGVSSGCLKYEKSPLDSAQGGEFGPLATLLLGSRPAHFLAFTNTMTLLELQGNGEWTSINYNSGGGIISEAVYNNGKLIGIDPGNATSIFVSDDMGRNWTAIANPDALNPPTRIGSYGKKIIIGTTSAAITIRGVFSSDFGNSWAAPVALQGGGTPAVNTTTCASSHCFFGGNAGGVNTNRYTDDGINWLTPAGLTNTVVSFSAIGSTVLALDTTPEIFFSTDGGNGFVPGSLFSLDFYPALTQDSNFFYEAAINGSNCNFRRAPASAPDSWTLYQANCSMGGPQFNGGTAANGLVVIGGCQNACTAPLMFRSENYGLTYKQDTLPGGFTSVRSILVVP